MFLSDPEKLHTVVGVYFLILVGLGLAYGLAKRGKAFFREFL